MKSSYLLKAAIVLFVFSVFSPNEVNASIKKFSQVTENIFRGGRPGDKDLANLKNDKNLKMIINLESTSHAIQHEKQVASRLGVDFFASKMDTSIRPSDYQVNQILAAMKDPNNFPIFIHCFHGEDRSGLIIGLYRVEVQGWPADQAYKEMLKMGYNPKYIALDKFFRDRTGYRGR